MVGAPVEARLPECSSHLPVLEVAPRVVTTPVQIPPPPPFRKPNVDGREYRRSLVVVQCGLWVISLPWAWTHPLNSTNCTNRQ